VIFGGKDKVREVHFSELADMLNSDFESRMAGFSERCRQAVSKIDRSQRMFLEACSGFERINVKPDIDREYYYSKVDPSLIESQKANYIKALRGIVGSGSPALARNTYESNTAVLGAAKAQRDKVLKTNGTFRGVFMAYAKHLERFKEASLELDRAISKLEYELEREKDSYEEYKRMIDSAFRLSDLVRMLEEAKMEERGIDKHERDDTAETAAKEEARKIRDELSHLSESIEGPTTEILALFLPLERPARKYDHVTGKKNKLSDAIERPIDTVSGVESYQRLREDLLSMDEAIRKGEIELKNKDDVLGNIAKICDPGLVEKVLKTKKMENERTRMEQRLLSAEAELDKETAKSMENAVEIERKKGLQQEIRSVSEEIATISSAIENAYGKSYKRRIKILTDH
jgi:hypothetical protein